MSNKLPPFDKLRVLDLKLILKSHGLPLYGNKSVLLARVKNIGEQNSTIPQSEISTPTPTPPTPTPTPKKDSTRGIKTFFKPISSPMTTNKNYGCLKDFRGFKGTELSRIDPEDYKEFCTNKGIDGHYLFRLKDFLYRDNDFKNNIEKYGLDEDVVNRFHNEVWLKKHPDANYDVVKHGANPRFCRVIDDFLSNRYNDYH